MGLVLHIVAVDCTSSSIYIYIYIYIPYACIEFVYVCTTLQKHRCDYQTRRNTILSNRNSNPKQMDNGEVKTHERERG